MNHAAQSYNTNINVKSTFNSGWNSAETNSVSSGGWRGSSSSSSWVVNKAYVRNSKETIKDSSSGDRTICYNNKDSPEVSSSMTGSRNSRELSNDLTNNRATFHDNMKPLNGRVTAYDNKISSKDSSRRSSSQGNEVLPKSSISWSSGKSAFHGNKDFSRDGSSWSRRYNSHEARQPCKDADASKDYSSSNNGGNVVNKYSRSVASNRNNGFCGEQTTKSRTLNTSRWTPPTGETGKISQSHRNKLEIAPSNINARIEKASKSRGVSAHKSSSSSLEAKSKTNSYSMKKDAKSKDTSSWSLSSPTTVVESKEQQSLSKKHNGYLKQEPSKKSSTSGWSSSKHATLIKSSAWVSSASSSWNTEKKSSAWVSSKNSTSSHAGKSNKRLLDIAEESDSKHVKLGHS